MPPTTETKIPAEPVSLQLIEPVAPEVPVGSQLSFKVRATSAAGRDLSGGTISVLAAEETIATQPLMDSDAGAAETDPFILKAPGQVGEFTWLVHFAACEIGGVAYAASSLPVLFRTRPLLTSLAVWDVPSPVLAGERFQVKVGAKSSGACELRAAKVEVTNEDGRKIGDGAFGETPLPQTDALFWTEITLMAPAAAGAYSWRVAFAADDLALPHDAASAIFGFAAVKRPEHRLTVRVIEREVAAPIADVQLGLGPYRAATDETGQASVDVPAGHYQLDIWNAEFEFVSQPVEVKENVAVQVELTRLPKERTVWD